MTTKDSGLYPTEFWTATAGDLSQKRDHLPTPQPTALPGNGAKIVIDPADQHQEWIGAGAAITDAAASLIWKQSKEQRSALLHELFDPEEGHFSTIRVPLGS